MNFNCVNNSLGHCGTVGTRTRFLAKELRMEQKRKNRRAWQI